MMSVRLQPELETQLTQYCAATSLSKNAVMNLALSQFIQTANVSTVPLAKDVLENAEDRFTRLAALRTKQYEQAVEITGWITSKTIWTKKWNPADPGSPRPGILGRNTVVGFTDTFWLEIEDEKSRDKKRYQLDERVYVIALHHTGRHAAGPDAHHRYVMTYDEWKANMQMVAPKAL